MLPVMLPVPPVMLPVPPVMSPAISNTFIKVIDTKTLRLKVTRWLASTASILESQIPTPIPENCTHLKDSISNIPKILIQSPSENNLETFSMNDKEKSSTWSSITPPELNTSPSPPDSEIISSSSSLPIESNVTQTEALLVLVASELHLML